MLLFNSAAMLVELSAVGFSISIDAAMVALAFQFYTYFLITMNLFHCQALRLVQ